MKLRLSLLLAAVLLGFARLSAQEYRSCGKVTDVDGNVYNTVLIGKQCWMKENLRVRHYPDAKDIFPEPQVCDHFHDIDTFGLLYTWKSVLYNSEPTEETDGRVQGVCPDGWHVPSNFEWMNLEDYVGYSDDFRCGSDVNYVAKALSSKTFWSSDHDNAGECSIAYNLSGNNVTYFSVYPTGGRLNGRSFGFGEEAGFWTCSNGSEDTSPIHFFYYLNASVEINCTPKEAFYSVRCVKNED